MSRKWMLFVVALLLFTGLSAYQLTLPGLHYDEAFEAVPAMQLLLGQPATTFRGNGVLLGERLFPLMTQDYIGAINTYLAIPFFVLLGITPFSLRLMSVVVGIVTIFVAYQLADEIYGPDSAGLTALLLAVDPTFVFWSRQGVFVTSVTAAIGLASAWAWLRWWRTGSTRYAVLGSFLFGLGIYAKLLFVWLIFALALTAGLLSLGRWQRVWARISPRLVVGCGLAFLVGAAPLIVYNLQTGGTFDSIFGNLAVSYYGINNLAFFWNLVERIKQFGVVLNGGHLWYLGDVFVNWLSVAVFLMALGIGVWLIVRAALASDSTSLSGARKVLFPFAVIGGVVLASCATVSALWVTHFALIAPWSPLAVAGVASLVIKRTRKPLYWGLVLAVVGAAWVGDVYTDVRYHRALAISGGLGTHSDASVDLANWLAADEHRSKPVVAMDWGIAATVTFLTRGQITPVEAFGYDWETDAEFISRLNQFIENPDTIYLWRAPDEIIFDRSLDFKRLYEPHGLEEDILEAFYERSGRPVLGATQLVPRGSALNPPQPR